MLRVRIKCKSLQNSKKRLESLGANEDYTYFYTSQEVCILSNFLILHLLVDSIVRIKCDAETIST